LKKILLIQSSHDDDSKIQEALENAGYITYITAGEFDGLKIAERYPADAIVCELDDFEKELKIIKELNQNPVTEYIPLFLITSTGQIPHIRAAMELGADDVLVKPINKESLLRSLNTRLRKIEILKEKLTDKIISTESAFSEKSKKTDHILVKIGKKLKIVEYSSIVCITALKEYSKFITEDGSKIVVRKSIRNWLETLPGKDFLRIHRATIINMTYIDKIEKSGVRGYCVHLKNIPEAFPMSQRYGNLMRKTFSV
jgi:two-component system LytT family response regulator